MDYNILYILVSNDEDNYYEQLLLSLISLKKHMPDSKVILLTDNFTFDNLVGFRSECKKYINEIKVIQFPHNTARHQISRELKTKARLYIEGDYLFIDTDTLICKPFLVCPEYEMSAVLDSHANINEFRGQSDERNKASILGYPEADRIYLNSGVLFCKDTPSTREFYQRWNSLYTELFEKGIKSDQISFNLVNREMNYIIKEIDGYWNCQVRFGAKFLDNCFIFHYGGNPSREHICYLTRTGAFDEMKQKKTVTDYYRMIINDPLKSVPIAILLDANAPEINCSSFYMLRLLSWKHRGVFKVLNIICDLIYKIKKLIFN